MTLPSIWTTIIWKCIRKKRGLENHSHNTGEIGQTGGRLGRVEYLSNTVFVLHMAMEFDEYWGLNRTSQARRSPTT